jgi:hypothetical protein
LHRNAFEAENAYHINVETELLLKNSPDYGSLFVSDATVIEKLIDWKSSKRLTAYQLLENPGCEEKRP